MDIQRCLQSVWDLGIFEEQNLTSVTPVTNSTTEASLLGCVVSRMCPGNTACVVGYSLDGIPVHHKTPPQGNLRVSDPNTAMFLRVGEPGGSPHEHKENMLWITS